MTKVLGHLNLHYNPTLPHTVTIPRVMPRMSSLFLTRALSDRPSLTNTALSLAAYHRHLDIIDLLLAENGLDVTATNKFGETALSKAAWNGHEQVVKRCLLAPTWRPHFLALTKGPPGHADSFDVHLTLVCQSPKYLNSYSNMSCRVSTPDRPAGITCISATCYHGDARYLGIRS